MFKKPFVVLDLETNGVDPKHCQIIEAAIVRFENGKETERLDALVKIGTPLPRIITVITGITDEELAKKGRPAADVFAEIEAICRDAYIVGHNINFDSSFLRAAGVKLHELGLIDTIPLAQIVLPQAASYSLESLTDDLGIVHKDRHRAMGDVEATADLFRILWEKIDALPAPLIAEIQQHLARSTWEGGVVFAEAKGSSTVSKKSHAITATKVEAMLSSGAGITRALDVETIFDEGGLLSQVLPGAEPRPQQAIMARHVMNAFEQGYHLICEAPTGVGKSLAYLSAAAAIAIQNKSKVVISTNTINLQQQLFEKDIPLLHSLYQQGTGARPLRTAVLKGRSHYLCLRRFAEFRRRPRFSDNEIILLIKVLVWQAVTQTGDSAEIHLTQPETLLWDFELCSEKKFCSPQKCKPYGDCYLHRARELAEDADILIVNHALLCADLAGDGGLLPEYRYLVVDEAHHFEETCTEAFGVSLSQENISLPLKAIKSHLEDFQRQYGNTLFATHSSFRTIDSVLSDVPDLQQFIDNFFSVVSLFVGRHVPESAYVENLLVDQAILGLEDWMNLGTSMEEVLARLGEWLRRLRQLLDQLLLADVPNLDDRDAFVDGLLQEIESMQEQLGRLRLFFDEESAVGNRQIRFLSSDLHGVVGLHLAPMVVGSRLKEILYDQKTSVVLTSATLGVPLRDGEQEQHPFTYLRQMLSLDDRFEEVILDSPFDFEKQAYVLTPTDALPLTAKNSMQQVSDFFAKLIGSVKGGLLGLFTSYASIETLYLQLVDREETHGTRLIGQRISGGRNKVMKAYLNDPLHSALFGTASFWEGVDIQGEALTTLVIHRLPFDVPSNPIFKARQELFGNAFMEYSVPRAILRFKQGFGRLIRSTKDYGVMIILDDRVTTKDYGKLFLEALPAGLTIEHAKLAAIPGKAGEWLKLQRENT